MRCSVGKQIKRNDEIVLFFSQDHKENKEVLSKTVIQQLFKRIGGLLNSVDEQVQVEAGSA